MSARVLEKVGGPVHRILHDGTDVSSHLPTEYRARPDDPG